MRQLFLFILIGFANASLAQSTIGNIIHDGIEREYRLYVPSIYTGDEPVPLVFNLHGYGSNAFQQEFYGNFRTIADTANFILIHPEGLIDGGGSQFWNAFGVSEVDDVGFLSAMIDTLSAEYNIDPQCVYSTGMSNGGFMSFELACMLSDRIAAVASVTGSMAEDRLAACDPAFARPVMQIHGTQDETVPYEGNIGFASIPDVIDFWVEINGCNQTPEVSDIPDIDPDDETTTERFLYADGTNGNTVEHFKVENGGHTWPGTAFVIGSTSLDFNASVEIWRFFRQHKLNGPTSVSEIVNQPALQIYPNPSHGEVFVQCDAQIEQIRITDMTGRLVNQFSAQSSSIRLQLKEKGVFIVQVQTESGPVFQKLVVR
jgi:polyhydroxybutyrate depolymerase